MESLIILNKNNRPIRIPISSFNKVVHFRKNFDLPFWDPPDTDKPVAEIDRSLKSSYQKPNRRKVKNELIEITVKLIEKIERHRVILTTMETTM